ncbi:MAG: cupredoxin domain-containing protein [Actinomycetia bacterium]|nr:cupredoxin domain-containing protein [Actinomycetes bacterium]
MSRIRNGWRITILALAVVLVAAACGGDSAAEPDDSGNITIDLSEFSFSPDGLNLKVGDTVTITLRNTGEKPHEWMIGRDVDTDEGFPDGFHENFFDDVMGIAVAPEDAAMGQSDMDMDSTDTTVAAMEDEMGHGFMVMRPPGEQATVTFTVTEDQIGEWEMACFEEDGAHYDDGMKGKVTVEA